MIYFIIFIVIAYISNALVDAIDHGKGQQTLKYLWHFCKWFICLPCYFLAGISLISFLISSTPFEVISIIWKLYTWKIIVFWIGLHILWESFYKLFRFVFDILSIPDWF